MDAVLRRAAKSALVAWCGDYSDQDNLTNDLWVWYLERPGTQEQLRNADSPLRHTLIRNAALQMLAKKSLSDDTFAGRNNYSSESVKDALKGVSTNRYLLDILPMAMKELDQQNEEYAEALRSRYDDGDIPQGKQAEHRLSRAHRALTEHVNLIAFKAGVDSEDKNTQGPGSRHAVFADSRRGASSGPSDPTGDMAIALIEHGDDVIELHNNETTTLRKEFMDA